MFLKSEFDNFKLNYKTAASSHSSILFSPNTSVAYPDSLHNLDNLLDSGFDKIEPTIHHVKAPPSKAKDASLYSRSEDANYLAYDIFERGKLFVRQELKNKHKTINKIFKILHNCNNDVTEHCFHQKHFTVKNL